jgi:pyruvate,orthophosphate dikinase
MRKPAVVGATGLTVDVAAACVRAGGRTVPEGTRIAIDGTGGQVVVGEPRIVATTTGPHLHRLLEWADEIAGHDTGGSEAERLVAAHAALRFPEEGLVRVRGGRTRPAGRRWP